MCPFQVRWCPRNHPVRRYECNSLELSGRRSLSDKATSLGTASLFSSFISFSFWKKNNLSFLQDFQFEFGYNKLFTVEPEGRSGGLAIFYLDSFDVFVLYSNNLMIDTEATIEGYKVYNFYIWWFGRSVPRKCMGTPYSYELNKVGTMADAGRL